MASPVDNARAATNITTAATSHAINVNTPNAGDLLVVFVRFAGAPGAVTFVSTNGDYTLLTTVDPDASDDVTNIYFRYADGVEGATDTMTTGNSIKLAAICWEITGAAGVPNISNVAVGTTTLNTCDPGPIGPPNPPVDTLYLACGGQDGEVGAFTAAPASYGSFQAANSGTGGLPATNVQLGGASRQISASSSDDPGAFTHAAAAAGWAAFTVAIAAPYSSGTSGTDSLETGGPKKAGGFERFLALRMHPVIVVPEVFVPRNPAINHQDPGIL